ncbi:MAG TPA: hypothetical protein VGI39_31695 [Polyangiaceae bacterium]|jgi:hypothetical protein
MNRRHRRAALIGLLASAAFVSTVALAQNKRPGPHRHPRPKPALDAGASAPEKSQPDVAPAARAEEGAKSDGGVLESKTLDGGTRVFRFGEVEIEGRLRNPQLVYFLRRVRAEFAAGDLGHRSFMRELSDTRHDPSF